MGSVLKQLIGLKNWIAIINTDHWASTCVDW